MGEWFVYGHMGTFILFIVDGYTYIYMDMYGL